MSVPDRYSDEAHGPIQEDLRQRIAAAIQDRGSVLVWDTVAIFPFSGTELLEPEYCNRMGEIVAEVSWGPMARPVRFTQPPAPRSRSLTPCAI